MQENALMMANDEFMERYDAAIEEIDDIRNKKRMEFVKINNAANQVFDDLQPSGFSLLSYKNTEAIL